MIRSPAGFDGGDRIKRYLDYYQPSYGIMMLSAGQFSPASLFASGEQGVWYDPSDMTTLFQDSFGTTPVTAVEQPVGLMLDKSKGLVLGSELVTNGTFDSDTTGWSLAGGGGSFASVSGELEITRGPATTYAVQSLTITPGKSYKLTAVSRKSASAYSAQTRVGTSAAGSQYGIKEIFSTTNVTIEIYFTATASTLFVSLVVGGTLEGSKAYFDNISVRELPGNHASQSTSASRPVLSARVNLFLNSATLSTQNVTTVATNYTLRFEGAGSVTLSGTGSGTYNAGTHTVTCTAGTLTVTVTGSVSNADIRVANIGVSLPAYQAITTATSYDTNGFPMYLKFDGTDDSMSTGTINPGSVDKAQVFAGVRKLSDAALGMVAETSISSTSNAGTIYLITGTGSPDYYAFRSGGTTYINASATSAQLAAPITNVLTGLGDISGDLATIRVNGTQAGQNTANQGTGNYLSYPLYIGSRGGSSLRFNGHLYSLVVRFSATNLPAATIAQTETWVNGKTRAY